MAHILYVTFFHPISKFKGPFLWTTFRFPFIKALTSGSLPHRISELHAEYGPIVRVAPDELSFTDPVAWRDIHAKNLLRAPQYSNKPPGKDAENLISANESDHARFRKVMAPAFAEKSVHEHEEAIQEHVNLLIQRLHQRVGDTDSNQTMNILQWFNYTTLDMIGDFVLSSSFGCLEREQMPSWMRPLNQFKITMFRVAFRYYPPVDSLLNFITPKAALAPLMNIWRRIEESLSKRLTMSADRSDIIHHIIAANESPSDLHMSRSEIEINILSLIVAGSESVTTVLTGITNYLLRNPSKLNTLVQETRSSFPNETDITGVSLSRLPYLNAVLQEGLRLCPTIPDGMRRITPKGGAAVAGHFLPEDITVSIPQWATYQSSRNFHSPSSFLPERWLPSSAEEPSPYAQDRKDAFNPFSLGARNCPGRGLAWLEMRLILARVLWNFDIATPTGVELPVWERQEIYWFWVKEPLVVRLRRAR